MAETTDDSILPLPAVTWADVPAADGVVQAYPAPRRVTDGLIASTLARPVWSLALDRLDAADVERIVAVAALAGRRCVAVAWPAGSASGVQKLPVNGLGDLPAACGVAPADVLHIGTDADLDGLAARGSGIRPLLIGTSSGMRHVLSVRDANELVALVRGDGAIASVSTYHEV